MASYIFFVSAERIRVAKYENSHHEYLPQLAAGRFTQEAEEVTQFLRATILLAASALVAITAIATPSQLL